MLKKLLLLAALLPTIALADAPVIWSGTTAKWLPAGLKSAGMCKLSSAGVMTSGQADLTTNVTGILPLANGGTAKNMTAVPGGILYTDADSVEVSTAGTTGRAVLSGGTGAPTYFAPTVGSVIFAGASGILDEDNSALFFDKTNNRLGLNTASPSGTLDITNPDDSIRGNIVLWGQGRGANSEWLLYDSPGGDLSFYNPNQAVYGFSMRSTGGAAVGTYSLGNADQMLGIRNNAGEINRHSLIIQKLGSQTGDFIRLRDTDNTTVLAKVAIDGAATFNGVTSNLTGNVTGNLTGNADTATALAANPTDCAANEFASAIAASGNLTCSSIPNAATTATSSAGNSTIVARDGSGNFSAGTITAALSGNASTASALAANPTDCGVGEFATAIAANGNLTCSAVNLAADVSGLLPTTKSSALRVINAQTGTSYTFVLADGMSQGSHPLVTGSNASATTFTVPPNSSVAFPVGEQLDVCQVGAGKLTLAQGSGVTINSKSSNKAIGAQYVCVTLVKTATDTWLLTGDLIP